MVDWSLQQPMPSFASAALSGYQAGAVLGKQRRFDAALGNLDLSRPETVIPLVAADPERGAPVLGAALKIADAKRQSEAHSAFGDAVAAMYGQPSLGGGASASTGAALSSAPPAPSPGAALSASPAASAVPSDPTASNAGAPTSSISPAVLPSASNANSGDVVVTAPHPLPDPQHAAMVRLAYRDPDAFKSLVDVSSKIDTAKAQTISDAQDALATTAMIVRRLPYEQRAARIQSLTPWLMQHHVSQAQINGFDPTDNNLDDLHDQALGTKGIIDQANKDRAFQLDQARFTESQRHDRADEATAAQNAATSRGQLGVAQGRLGLARKVAGRDQVSSSSTPDLLAIARGQKAAPQPSASDIFAIAGER